MTGRPGRVRKARRFNGSRVNSANDPPVKSAFPVGLKPAFGFDLYGTLVESTQWNAFEAGEDPLVYDLAQKRREDRAAWNDAYVALFDKYVAEGKVKCVPAPGAESALIRMSMKGVLVAFSSGTEASLTAMIEQAGFSHFFPDKRFVIPQGRFGVDKTNPLAFEHLEAYLSNSGLSILSYADDSRDIVEAVVASGANIQDIFHVDRSIRSQHPSQMNGYVRVPSLSHVTMALTKDSFIAGWF